MPLEPGTTLGPYEILAPIGAGGMGEVYEARDTRVDRTVAIKVLPEQLATDSTGCSLAAGVFDIRLCPPCAWHRGSSRRRRAPR